MALYEFEISSCVKALPADLPIIPEIWRIICEYAHERDMLGRIRKVLENSAGQILHVYENIYLKPWEIEMRFNPRAENVDVIFYHRGEPMRVIKSDPPFSIGDVWDFLNESENKLVWKWTGRCVAQIRRTFPGGFKYRLAKEIIKLLIASLLRLFEGQLNFGVHIPDFSGYTSIFVTMDYFSNQLDNCPVLMLPV